jgi:hypothetical protein
MDLMYRVGIDERFFDIAPSHSLPCLKALHHQQTYPPRPVRVQKLTTATTDNNRSSIAPPSFLTTPTRCKPTLAMSVHIHAHSPLCDAPHSPSARGCAHHAPPSPLLGASPSNNTNKNASRAHRAVWSVSSATPSWAMSSNATPSHHCPKPTTKSVALM